MSFDIIIPLSQNTETSDLPSNCEIYNPINVPRPLKQQELNPGLPKNASGLLDSHLTENNLVDGETAFEGIEEEKRNFDVIVAV